jgi:hypothetical protein
MSKLPQQTDLYAQLEARDNQPEPLKKVLAREQADYDCLSCRVMGVYFFPQYFHHHYITTFPSHLAHRFC